MRTRCRAPCPSVLTSPDARLALRQSDHAPARSCARCSTPLCPSVRTRCAGAHARSPATSSRCVAEPREIPDADTRAPDRHTLSRATSRPTVAQAMPCACAGTLTACAAARTSQTRTLLGEERARISPKCTLLVANLALTRSKQAPAGPIHWLLGATRRLIGAKGTAAGAKWTPIAPKRGPAPATWRHAGKDQAPCRSPSHTASLYVIQTFPTSSCHTNARTADRAPPCADTTAARRSLVSSTDSGLSIEIMPSPLIPCPW